MVSKFLEKVLEGHADLIMYAHLGDIVLDDAFARQVTLVADQQLVDTLGSITIDFLQPLLDIGECV